MIARSYGSGRYSPADLGSLGEGAVIEEGVLIFNPAYVHLASNVYIGHRAMLCGDTRGELRIEEDVWVGPDCYMHSAGSIRIGRGTGIGPRVAIFTSVHSETPFPTPITDAPLQFAEVEIGEGCDIGVASVLLPGARLGAGVQIGAGSVVIGEIPPGVIAAGVPARVKRRRGERPAARRAAAGAASDRMQLQRSR
jgi:acetyltransferase-like isoleucine patch superfamily enzyme